MLSFERLAVVMVSVHSNGNPRSRYQKWSLRQVWATWYIPGRLGQACLKSGGEVERDNRERRENKRQEKEIDR